MTKKILLGAGAAVLIIAGYVGSLYYRASTADAPLLDKLAQIEANQKAYFADQASNDAKWNALEAADTYGGKTPEETWDLYIVALKAGDIDLASKYFRVDKQAEELASSIKAKEKGNLQKFIAAIDIKKTGEYSDDKKNFTFSTVPFGSDNRGYTYEFKLNEKTGVWKILEL
jgi:hypothetical protein